MLLVDGEAEDLQSGQIEAGETSILGTLFNINLGWSF